MCDSWNKCLYVPAMKWLKIIKRPAVRYFNIFLFEIQKIISTKMFYLYLQSSGASRQPKISNLMFFANPLFRARSHPNAWHLKTFQWHGWTRFSNNSIFLFEIYRFCVGKYSTFIYNPQALLEIEKFQHCPFRWPSTQSARDPSVTLRKFSPDTTGHYRTRSSNN